MRFADAPPRAASLIDSARRSLTELGMRHALLEVDQFAGIVELVADDPAAAEPHLRRAYNGFRRMGLDADTAETAALLARACLALDRDAEADELCTESERLAGHALKASIAWRTVRAQLLARRGDHDEARRVAEEAVAVAERTDALVDHGDACLALATVLEHRRRQRGGAGRRRAGGRTVRTERCCGTCREGAQHSRRRSARLPRLHPKRRSVELDNACVRAMRTRAGGCHRSRGLGRGRAAVRARRLVESRRKIVGFTQIDLPSDEWRHRSRGAFSRRARTRQLKSLSPCEASAWLSLDWSWALPT